MIFLIPVRDAYRRDLWESQPSRVEIWLEKDAESGFFRQYGTRTVELEALEPDMGEWERLLRTEQIEQETIQSLSLAL